jgi:hypothetical protein
MSQTGRSRVIDIMPKPPARGPMMAAGGIIVVGLIACGVVWTVAVSLWNDEKAAEQCRSDRAAFDAVQEQIVSEGYAAAMTSLPHYGHSGMRVVRVKGRACTFQVTSHVILMDESGQRYLEPVSARATFDKAERRWMVTAY